MGALDPALLAVGLLTLVVAAGSHYLAEVHLSGPVVALITGVVLGPEVADVIPASGPGPEELLHEVARVSLAVSLVAVALRFPIAEVRARGRELAWLLLVAMPVMALVSATVAALTLPVGIGAALVLGAVLAPTDPILASGVATGEGAERSVPQPLRHDLSLESGANDGLAVAMVITAAAVASGASLLEATWSAVWHIAGAIVLGVALGHVAGSALMAAERRGAVETPWAATYTLVLSLAALGLGGVTRTGELLLVFTAGLAANAAMTSEERRTEELVDESVHRVLVLPLFVLLGASLPWAMWGQLGAALVPFVLGVLLLRRLPVVLALHRPLGTNLRGAAWLGWFGPIGGAAIAYVTTLPRLSVHDERLWGAGCAVIVASTVSHGVTSTAGQRWLARAAD